MGKKKIAVVFGGCSPEYDVSLQSAYSVASAIPDKYDTLLLGITRAGKWYRYTGPLEKIRGGVWETDAGHCRPAVISPDRPGCLLELGGAAAVKTALDIVFPVLHGRNGEDGTIQGLCELAGLPVVGCKTLGSALCMDKDKAHRLVAGIGIAVPKSVCLPGPPEEDALPGLTAGLAYPLFVKPLRAGSSIGVAKVTSPRQLAPAVAEAFRYDDAVVVEEGVPGFEVGCAVMGNADLYMGRADEIELADGFFDYAEKYTLKTSKIHMPARLDGGTESRVRETAGRIYRVLGCTGYARVDLFLTPSNELVFNEVNTIPGFTAHSRFPNMMKGAGLGFGELIGRLIELGLEA